MVDSSVIVMNRGTIRAVGISGITWYLYGYSVMAVLLALSSAMIMYVTFVQYGNAGMVPL